MKIRDKSTENRILKAALKQFGDKGFYKTTVDDIARSACIAKGTIYLHVKNKESIYVGTCAQQFDQLMKKIIAELDAGMTAEQKLAGIALFLGNYITKIKASYPFFNMENIHLTAGTMKGLRSVVMPKMIKMNEMIAEVINQGIRDKEFRNLDSQITAFCFINLIRSLFMGMMFT